MLKQPQQKRSEETLQRVLLICEELVEQGRFEQVSMQEIARSADVSVGTLYKRFEGKSAILDHLIERLQTEQYERFVAELSTCRQGDLGVRLRFLSDLLYRSIDEHQGLLRAVTTAHLLGRSPVSDVTAARSEGLIEAAARWLDDSEGSPGPDACRQTVAMVAFAFQYRAIYPTPDLLLGADVYRQLACDMASKYLGV